MPKQFSSRKAQRAASDPQSDRVFQQNWPRAVAQPDGRTADPTAALLGTAAIRSVPVRSGQNTARRTRLEAASLPGIGAQPSDQTVHLVQSYPPPKKKRDKQLC